MQRIKREISSSLEVMGKPKELIEDLVNISEAFFITIRNKGYSVGVERLLDIFKDFDSRGFLIVDYNSVYRNLGGYDHPITILWECLVVVFGEFTDVPRYGYITELKRCIKYLESMRHFWSK